VHEIGEEILLGPVLRWFTDPGQIGMNNEVDPEIEIRAPIKNVRNNSVFALRP
jgi:hypothetical protein